MALLLLWELFVVQVAGPIGLGFDTAAYWGYPRDSVYAFSEESRGYGIYRYSPSFVPLMTLGSAIPFDVFVGLWFVAMVAVYVWMCGPFALPSLAFLPVLMELGMGNIHLFLALAVVLGFRWPAAWAFVLLTKVTPGIGLLWFAARREWRSLAVALGTTVAIVAISTVLTPDLWVDWVRSLATTSQPDVSNVVAIPLSVRLVVAAMLVVWGARTDRRWTVMVAATISLPVVWHHGLAMLVGVIALRRGWPETMGHAFDWLWSWRRPRAASTTADYVAAGGA